MSGPGAQYVAEGAPMSAGAEAELLERRGAWTRTRCTVVASGVGYPPTP